MSRNQVSRFSLAPVVRAPRSVFDATHDHKTSFNVGDLCVFDAIPILPGDTWKVKTSKVARMQTLKTPMMQDIILDTYWFFVPNRLVWTHWKEFMGENNESAWLPETTYTIPQIESPEGGWSVGSIADHLGIPPLVDNLSIGALKFRGYALIANEWFRSEVVQDPLAIEFGDSTVIGSNGDNYVDDIAKGGKMFTVNRTFDLFSGATIAPQKGEPVSLSLASPVETQSPVYTIGFPNSHFNYAPTAEGLAAYDASVKAQYPLMMESAYTYKPEGTNIAWPKVLTGTNQGNGASFLLRGVGFPTNSEYSTSYEQAFINDSSSVPHSFLNMTNLDVRNSGQSPSVDALTPVNLVADVNHALSMITVNDLRQAFQIQRFMERESYSGSRYIEVLRAHFGVTAFDSVLQRPEYLGGSRIPLNIRQITQTSQTTDSSPMGDVAGMSVTADNHFDFEKSFTEHGYLFGFVVARYNHVYQQGIARDFWRKTKYDLFWPEFNSLGNFGIYNGEIYAQGTDEDKEIFGYQEAWYDYRSFPSTISGMMRSVSGSGLDTWHMADYYEECPRLSADWLAEDKTNVDRVLTVSSDVSDQIFIDIHIDAKATRPMTAYSIPGLIDHF